MKIESSIGGAASEAAQALRSELRVGGEPGIGGVGSSGATTQSIAEAGGFATVLERTALAASAKEREAMAKADALAAGRIDDLHGTMITMKEADISMKLVGSVRDKLLDAFHEIWRINV